ncbi:MAG: hypothetical protein BWK78_02820 [Thiotrichaceae bacterium IS1]|nr:MAG: hypothetical protein BWK78_02820 [Thiotrichaceae bacterium IS1]
MQLSNVSQDDSIFEKQMAVLEQMEKSSDEYEDFLLNPAEYCQKQGTILPFHVIDMLSNPTLFDGRLEEGISEKFWIERWEEPLQTLIYRADPTVTVAFAFGVVAGKMAAAGAVGAAGVAGSTAAYKAMKNK